MGIWWPRIEGVQAVDPGAHPALHGLIEAFRERTGVPTVLVSLPHVESSYNPIARSFVGAAGLWQFTRSTGRRFMQIDHVVDDEGRSVVHAASPADRVAEKMFVYPAEGICGQRREAADAL